MKFKCIGTWSNFDVKRIFCDIHIRIQQLYFISIAITTLATYAVIREGLIDMVWFRELLTNNCMCPASRGKWHWRPDWLDLIVVVTGLLMWTCSCRPASGPVPKGNTFFGLTMATHFKFMFLPPDKCSNSRKFIGGELAFSKMVFVIAWLMKGC